MILLQQPISLQQLCKVDHCNLHIFQVQFKMLVVKVLNCIGPGYLKDCLPSNDMVHPLTLAKGALLQILSPIEIWFVVT